MGRGSPIFQLFIPDRRLFGRSSYTGLYNYLRYSPTRNGQPWLLPSLPYKLSQRPKSCFRSVPIWHRIQVHHPTFMSRLPKPASIQRTTQVSVSLKTSPVRRHGSNSSFSRHRKQRHDRPIQCTVGDCQYRAAFNRDLKRHVASKHPQETSKERYFCHHPNCDRALGGIWNGFARKDTLKRHMSTKNHKKHEHETDRN